MKPISIVLAALFVALNPISLSAQTEADVLEYLTGGSVREMYFSDSDYHLGGPKSDSSSVGPLFVFFKEGNRLIVNERGEEKELVFKLESREDGIYVLFGGKDYVFRKLTKRAKYCYGTDNCIKLSYTPPDGGVGDYTEDLYLVY
jgi:hypothetical protein